MSTRANIKVEYNNNKKLYFYSHYDGYPDGGVGDDIKSIISANDWDAVGIVMDLIDSYEHTGGIHGDIEFYYVIDLNNEQVICHHVKDVVDGEIIDKEEPKFYIRKENNYGMANRCIDTCIF